MLLLFSGCMGFASQETPLHWLRKQEGTGTGRGRRKGPPETWDRFVIRANESCIPGNILMGLNGMVEYGIKSGVLLPGRGWVATAWPLEPQENTMRSRISPSQDKGADLDTLLVPLRKGVVEADTLRKHLRWPRRYVLVPFAHDRNFWIEDFQIMWFKFSKWPFSYQCSWKL